MSREIIKKIVPVKFHKTLSKFSRKISRFFWKKTSYSQCGEDIIIDFLLKEVLSIRDISYLDIGAHHSSFLSNTYLFYKKGFRGVLVEPDPSLLKEIRRKRSKDIIVACGVGEKKLEEVNFYILNHPELNTFSKELAEETSDTNKIKKIIKVPVLTINNIIENYCKKCPTFISIDIEGLDLDIIKTFDFNTYRPPVFCIETISTLGEEKIPEINTVMIKNDYFIFADTNINTIYADKRLMNARKNK